MIPFRAISEAALPNLEAILRRQLPGGQRRGREYVALNPTRRDRHLGSFRINLESGVWCDFATGDRGGDIISLIAYLDDLSQAGAARRLADELGIPLSSTSRSTAQDRQLARDHARRQQDLIRAEFWRRGRIAELESAKLAAYESDDTSRLAAAASELHQLQQAAGESLLSLYREARGNDSAGVARIERFGQEDLEQAAAVTALQLEILAESESTNPSRQSPVEEVVS